MRTYARKEDGSTYYFKKGVLYGHPTNKDGSCDLDECVEIPVSDYAEPLSDGEIAQIVEELTSEDKEYAQYSITSPDNFDAFVVEGNNHYLNDVNVNMLKAGNEIVIAWEGGSKKIKLA